MPAPHGFPQKRNKKWATLALEHPYAAPTSLHLTQRPRPRPTKFPRPRRSEPEVVHDLPIAGHLIQEQRDEDPLQSRVRHRRRDPVCPPVERCRQLTNRHCHGSLPGSTTLYSDLFLQHSDETITCNICMKTNKTLEHSLAT